MPFIPMPMPSFQQMDWSNAFLQIAIFLLAAWIIRWLSNWFSNIFLVLYQLSPRRRKKLTRERKTTLRALFGSIIRFTAIAAAIVASVSLFIDPDTLVWVVGLFSAAFGFGARPIISDLMAGLAFMSEDSFAVGEKLEVFSNMGLGGVQGIVESVNLRTTSLRATTGELYLIPNSELRIVRNFSRGRFSTVKITLTIASNDLGKTLTVLENMSGSAMQELPNLLEPWQVISDSGKMGEQTELTLIAKARFGKAAEMQPRLLALVQRELDTEAIYLKN